MVDILNKKSLVAKLSEVLPGYIAPKKVILDRINPSPPGPDAIGFAEFGHNCIITTISNCSCSMNFTMAFKPQPLMTFKQALFGKFTGFLPGRYSTLAWPCHMGRVDTG